MYTNWMRWAASLAVILSLLVVMLGGYTRLTNAGLGCPDWPGCYGHMVLPSDTETLNKAQTVYPNSPIESRKAWTEMLHRYAAGTLALLIFIIGGTTLSRAFKRQAPFLGLPLVLMLLVIFQAALGMWTVTLKLLPVVVMAHLLGGILIFSCLLRLRLQMAKPEKVNQSSWSPWIALAAFIVFLQIALGGWVSANYAGIACIGFPQCNGEWLPALKLSQGFNLFSPVGANYQGGLLDSEARAAIQSIHRLGALITTLYLLGLSGLILLKSGNQPLRRVAILVLILLGLQLSLGIINVLYLLPLWSAVAHNGVAAMLLASLFMMFYFSQGGRLDAK
ncbi:COX15/CtaA family protein [Legionella birminghamensis]|uniref:COX15/CtaA family protein n=1 Tax=Legionella birminghamensis TaxID=28083 RepID=UPI0015597A67|nr:COX15/CtaA family protein [Legionella birminghamensis]